jgi:hypothetical protein
MMLKINATTFIVVLSAEINRAGTMMPKHDETKTTDKNKLNFIIPSHQCKTTHRKTPMADTTHANKLIFR